MQWPLGAPRPLHTGCGATPEVREQGCVGSWGPREEGILGGAAAAHAAELFCKRKAGQGQPVLGAGH